MRLQQNASSRGRGLKTRPLLAGFWQEGPGSRTCVHGGRFSRTMVQHMSANRKDRNSQHTIIASAGRPSSACFLSLMHSQRR